MHTIATHTIATALSVALAALLLSGCGASGVDAQTAAFKATLGASCASNHDCAGNQRCLEDHCELEDNGCVSNEHCGSRHCSSGYCSLPAPALLTDERFQERQQGAPEQYLNAGRDGLVDSRGGLILGFFSKITVRGATIWWHEWSLSNWTAESGNPSSWRIVSPDASLLPERFVFKHGSTNSRLFAYARLLPSQSRTAATDPIAIRVHDLKMALESGAPFEDAIAGKMGSAPTQVERESAKPDRLAGVEATRYEGVRATDAGAERFRVFVARTEFGGTHYVVYVGLVAPADLYTSMLDELSEFIGAVSFAGLDAKVGQ